jgi:hypothetical protein
MTLKRKLLAISHTISEALNHGGANHFFFLSHQDHKRGRAAFGDACQLFLQNQAAGRWFPRSGLSRSRHGSGEPDSADNGARFERPSDPHRTRPGSRHIKDFFHRGRSRAQRPGFFQRGAPDSGQTGFCPGCRNHCSLASPGCPDGLRSR